MRTNTIVGALSLLLIFSYLLVYNFQINSFARISNCLPADTIALGVQKNLPQTLRQLARSDFGKALGQINFIGTLTALGATPKHHEQYRQLLQVISELENNRLLEEILGRRVALALLPPLDTDGERSTTAQFSLENLIIVAQPKTNARLLELVGSWYPKDRKGLTITQLIYGKHRINRISYGGRQIAMVNLDGFFVTSISERQLRRCIDAYDHDLPPLSDHQPYLAMRQEIASPDGFFYLNLDRVRETIRALIADYDLAGKGIIFKELENSKGFHSLAYGYIQKGKILEDTTVALYHPDQVNEMVRSYLTAEAGRSTMYGFTTAAPMSYYWSNTFQLKNLLPLLSGKSGAQAKDENRNLQSQVEALTGKPMRETLAAVTGEICLVTEASKGVATVSLPKGLAVFRLRDKELLQSLFPRLMDRYGLETNTRQYKGVSYEVWERSLEDGLTPLYGFWGNYLFVGNSRSLLQKVIDYRHEGRMLGQERAIKALDPGLGRNNNSITYLRYQPLLQEVQRVLRLAGVMMVLQDRELGGKVKLVIDNVALSVLEGLTTLDSSLSRSFFTKQSVVIHSKIAISQ